MGKKSGKKRTFYFFPFTSIFLHFLTLFKRTYTILFLSMSVCLSKYLVSLSHSNNYQSTLPLPLSVFLSIYLSISNPFTRTNTYTPLSCIVLFFSVSFFLSLFPPSICHSIYPASYLYRTHTHKGIHSYVTLSLFLSPSLCLSFYSTVYLTHTETNIQIPTVFSTLPRTLFSLSFSLLFTLSFFSLKFRLKK